VKLTSVGALGSLTIVRWLDSDSDVVELYVCPCSASEFLGVPELLISAMSLVIIANLSHRLV
jgi:hypothetical protein